MRSRPVPSLIPRHVFVERLCVLRPRLRFPLSLTLTVIGDSTSDNGAEVLRDSVALPGLLPVAVAVRPGGALEKRGLSQTLLIPGQNLFSASWGI
ncbi:5-Hydroxytryptamine Receptor 4 [Manis pentadactyla]|nr:5-Hydroxytryptamine Receptor 4 [Manis pentadactyla]